MEKNEKKKKQYQMKLFTKKNNGDYSLTFSDYVMRKEIIKCLENVFLQLPQKHISKILF